MAWVNQYKKVHPHEGWAYMNTLEVTDDLVRVIMQESGLPEARIRATLSSPGSRGIACGEFRFIPLPRDPEKR